MSATELFRAMYERSNIEDALLEGMEAAGLPDGWTDYWVDPYDISIEFGVVEPAFKMPQPVLAYLWAQGFGRCWVNYGDDKGALYFSPTGPASGSPSNSHGSKQPQAKEVSSSYRAGLAEGFRQGVQAAADYVTRHAIEHAHSVDGMVAGISGLSIGSAENRLRKQSDALRDLVDALDDGDNPAWVEVLERARKTLATQ